MQCIPEHVIISDEISRNGYRGVTLRLAPDYGGGAFKFFIVEGGLTKPRELANAWRTGVEIEGITYQKDQENFIRIKSIKVLNKHETRQWVTRTNALWCHPRHYEG